jgi:O-antigen chain-terminating methyltransferase
VLLGAVRTSHLAALADPGDAEIHSHRARLGQAIVAVKRTLRRLLTPVLDRQAAFNRAAIDSLAELERAAAAQISALSRHVLELDARLELLATPETPSEDRFDYRAFEAAFRGSREHVRAQQSRYLDEFPDAGSGPVLDLGCGRGEFLELLRESGVTAWGVERDAAIVEEARALGLDVRRGDLLWALESAADASLGGVVAFQVVEHLPFWKIVRLVHLARAKLRPGGCLILETVNVQSLIAWTRGWSLDPSHRQPVHPLTLRFLVERAGFSRAELRYSGEVEADVALEVGDGEDREVRNARRLNELLFAPQDYAVVARA